MPRGFSLIETTIAAGLLATVLAALAQLVAVAAEGGSAARSRTAAVMLAAQKAEELRTLPWDAIAGGGATDRIEGDTAFERTWSARPAPFNGGVLLITVTAAASGRTGVSATIVTARARRLP